jgi:hypothetical protein
MSHLSEGGVGFHYQRVLRFEKGEIGGMDG